jgi:hypothetical protein
LPLPAGQPDTGLAVTGEILRGSLLERTVFRHKANCEKCASGKGHPLNVLTVTYPRGRTRQISLHPELVVGTHLALEYGAAPITCVFERHPRVRQVIAQTRARIFRGEARTEGKIFSLFEPSTEIIRKGKAGKPNEFGKLVKLQEAENQIVIDYEVYDHRPNDATLLIPAIETHAAVLGRPPRLVAADAGFYSAKNEAAAKAKGVKRVCIPNRSTNSAARKREQKKRWFRNGLKWRTGCEGRISVVKRRHGAQPLPL